MINKILSIMFIILGIKVLLLQNFSGAWSSYTFSDNYLYVPLSLLLFYVAYLFLRYNPKEIEEKYSKCPKCKETFTYKDLDNGKCLNCKDVDTIDVEEYYEKYPEELEENK